MPDSNDQTDHVADFLSAIYGDGAGYVGLLTIDRSDPAEDIVLEDFFQFPSRLDQIVAHVRGCDAEGADVYACAHLLAQARRQKEDARPVLWLWCDRDAAQIPPGFPPPTRVIETSPGRFQDWWRLTEPIDSARAEQLNRRIAHAIRGDHGWHLGNVMRIPTTHNY